MLSVQAPEFRISTLAAFSTGFGLSFLYCTMHPSGSRSFGRIAPPARRSRPGDLRESLRTCPAPSSRRPLSRLTGPRKSSVPGRVQKRSTSMVGRQHYMAHGVVSKDEGLGSMSGVERLTNQLPWLFQQKPGFPVPAQSDYRNILSSLNST
jgi:hypothetical protein